MASWQLNLGGPDETMNNHLKPSRMSNQEQENERKKLSCDICRRRKIRCDKMSPCNQCTASFYDCIYSEPARQRKRRRVSPHRLEVLENRIQALETSSPQKSHHSVAHESDQQPETTAPHDGIQEASGGNPSTTGTPIVAEPVAKIWHSAEKGDIEFQGYSADRTFVQGFKDELGGWEFDAGHNKLPNLFQVRGLLDTSDESLTEVKLPEKAIAAKYIDAAIDAQLLFSVIHRPSFNSSFNLIYTLDQCHYSAHEWRFLALFYAVLAFGCLSADTHREESNEIFVEASSYYEQSRRLQNFAECKDIVSLQAIFFKIIFSVLVTRVFTSYTYGSAALSIAIRMGLHKTLGDQHDLLTREMGKRLFRGLWVLTNDIAAQCGLPKVFTGSEFRGQDFLEINDSYIERKRILGQPHGELCLITAANTYQKLQPTFHRIADLMYSEKCFQVPTAGGSVRYSVGIDTLQSLEAELQEWSLNLPAQFKLGSYFDNRKLLAAQFNLCMSYSHVQLLLYRPFLQHFTKRAGNHNNAESLDLHWLAEICIQACENVVMLCEDMFKRGLLNGANWIVSRALFSSSLTLFYAVLATRGTHQMQSFCKCLAMARKISDRLSMRSIPAHRWKVMLTIMVATLPASAHHIQEKLMEDYSSFPDLDTYEAEGKSPDDSYTISLSEQSFSNLSSLSSEHMKAQGLSPGRLATMRHGHNTEWNSISNSAELARCSPDGIGRAHAANESISEPNTSRQSKARDRPFENSSESGLQDFEFDISSIEFGNMDDFLDLQSWL